MQRINIQKIEPEAYAAMFALQAYLATTSLSSIEKELIKIRASQINNCKFCLDMHTKDAVQAGETPERISLLSAWKNSTVFSDEERALLAITEEITLIHKEGLRDETYAWALKVFGEQKLAQIIMTITTINAWNRIAIATKK